MAGRPTPVRRRSAAAVLALGLALTVTAAPAASAAPPASPAAVVAAAPAAAVAAVAAAPVTSSASTAAIRSTRGGAADPDTVQGTDGRYYTYSTKAKIPAGCSNAGRLQWVPLRVTATASLGGACPSRDAMPGGPGSWAYRGCNAAVWAPGVVRFGGRWILYYAASKAGRGASCSSRGQVCIGKAYASSPLGPFRDAGEFACPPAGRWALDPDPFVAGGQLYLVYRDDAVTSGAETGISGVRLTAAGNAIWSTRHTLVTSRAISWETRGTRAGTTHVIENPTMTKVGGRWRLLFSGNNYDSPRYSVGLADCGTAPVDGGCRISGSTSRPWFGYTGSGGLQPLHGLPGNHPGPGGMAAFTTSSGAVKVVWHWYDRGPRPALIGTLSGRLTVS